MLSLLGQHDIPASVGITGSIEFIELEGPEVILALTGKFWHRRGMLFIELVLKFCTHDVHKKMFLTYNYNAYLQLIYTYIHLQYWTLYCILLNIEIYNQ